MQNHIDAAGIRSGYLGYDTSVYLVTFSAASDEDEGEELENCTLLHSLDKSKALRIVYRWSEANQDPDRIRPPLTIDGDCLKVILEPCKRNPWKILQQATYLAAVYFMNVAGHAIAAFAAWPGRAVHKNSLDMQVSQCHDLYDTSTDRSQDEISHNAITTTLLRERLDCLHNISYCCIHTYVAFTRCCSLHFCCIQHRLPLPLIIPSPFNRYTFRAESLHLWSVRLC